VTPAVTPEPPPKNSKVSFAAVGDVLWGRYDEDKTYLPVSKLTDPFADVAAVLQGADLAFCNIESPVVPEPDSFGVYKRMTFRADPERMPVMAQAGFDVASLANNHMFNMKARSIAPSVQNVAAAGMHPGGAGATAADAMRPVLVDVHGMRVAFLFFTVWNNTGKSGFTKDGSVAFFEHEGKLEKYAAQAVIAARRYLGADYVVVSIHWGIEYQYVPHSGQVNLAKKVVAAGADLVFGHHPHVVQEVRRDGPAVVFYSLGNFMFDNPGTDRRETMIALPTLDRLGPFRWVDSVELEAVIIDRSDHAPRIARDKAGEKWRKRLAGLVPKDVSIRPAPAAP
jgi:poly-gamma-glutamate synthesis protein (capsule biosynthesis protein)